MSIDVKEQGKRIKARRKELGLSQQALAQRIGMPQSRVSDLEKGKGVSSVYLPALARELCVSPLWLQYGESSQQRAVLPDSVDGAETIRIPHITFDRLEESVTERKDVIYLLRLDWIIRNGYKHDRLCTVDMPDDAMMPTIKRGDVLVVDRSPIESPVPASIYLIKYGGFIVVRRLFPITGSTWEMRADSTNKAVFPNEVLPDTSLIAGEVVFYSVFVNRHSV